MLAGAFRASSALQFSASAPSCSGLLWKNPWRMSQARKSRVRSRLREVDSVIAAVKASGVQLKALDRALELPTESDMAPKDKYTVFSRYAKGQRKSVHKIPAFTKITQRVNPERVLTVFLLLCIVFLSISSSLISF